MYKSGKLWLLILFIIIFTNAALFLQLSLLDSGEHLGNLSTENEDYPTYLAKMRIGYEGGWEYINRYTTEPQQPSYIFLFYIALGHLARVAGWNLAFTYNAARIILSVLALLALHRFLNKHAGEGQCLSLFLLAVFTSGAYTTRLDLLPQYHLFSGMMGFAHYMLALITVLVFFDSVLEYPKERWLNTLKAILSLNLLALIHPFMVVLVGLVITGTVMLNKSLRESFFILFVSALSVVPAMLYFFSVFTTNPVLMGWREQAVSTSPLLFNVLLFGVGSIYAYLAVLLVLGGRIERSSYTNLCLSWLAVALALSFTKLIASSQQWLFFSGIPVSYLAYQFIGYLDKGDDFRLRLKGRSIIAWILLAFILIPGIGFMLRLDFWTYSLRANKAEHYDKFIVQGDMACFSWLRDNTPKEAVVLSNEKLGLLVPALSGRYAYLGHHHETIDFKAKKQRTEAFLNGSYNYEEAERFIKENKISYILAAERETAYEFLEPVMTGEKLTLYRYKGDGQA